jgi:uncharacterized membrane protein
MPAELTWHKWQAYWTWFSGFFLLVWIYYAQSSLYLIDPAVMILPAWQAAGIGVGSLVLGWRSMTRCAARRWRRTRFCWQWGASASWC